MTIGLPDVDGRPTFGPGAGYRPRDATMAQPASAIGRALAARPSVGVVGRPGEHPSRDPLRDGRCEKRGTPGGRRLIMAFVSLTRMSLVGAA